MNCPAGDRVAVVTTMACLTPLCYARAVVIAAARGGLHGLSMVSSHAGALAPAPLLVFGAGGQVAQEIGRIAEGLGFVATLAGRDRVDLMSQDGSALLDELRPRAVVNAAAYTAVDRAEQDCAAAYRLNAEIPGLLAQACKDRGMAFVHISADYVFDGAKDGAYIETDARAPLSVYGASKANGEDAIAAVGGESALVRTAWVQAV